MKSTKYSKDKLIDDEDFDQARQAITKLTDLFGLDPEIH